MATHIGNQLKTDIWQRIIKKGVKNDTFEKRDLPNESI